jgi:energy-coupling factor transport system ATP-binding protein
MRPTLLILDEPMGGLDPLGRREVLAALSALCSRQRDDPVTIVMMESDAEAAAIFADRVAILHNGRIILEGSPRKLFLQPERLLDLGVGVPALARASTELNKRMGTGFSFLAEEEALDALVKNLG